MWIVAKIKKNCEETIKKELNTSIKDNCIFYKPTIEVNRLNKKKNKFIKEKKNLLGNYLFCFHGSFDNLFNFNKIMFLKGLDYFLCGTKKDSEEISEFIKFCKKNENVQGVLENSFFFKYIQSNAKINSGPFANVILQSVLIEKNKLKAQVGNLRITLNKKSNNYCYPV